MKKKIFIVLLLAVIGVFIFSRNSEIDKFQKNTIVMCLEIEHMTGKLVNEA